MIYNNTGTVGLQDSDIFITPEREPSPPRPIMSAPCAKSCRALFPQVTFSYPPPDITSQILNFGAPAPLDVQVIGTDRDTTQAFALRILREIKKIPGLVDARMQQSSSQPRLLVDADRSRMAQLGLTEQDVTGAMATALAGTSQTAPNFWLNPKNGVSYNMTAQTPEYKLNSLEALQNLPVTPANGGGSKSWAVWPASAATRPVPW